MRRTVTTENGTSYSYSSRLSVRHYQGRYYHVLLDTIAGPAPDMITGARCTITAYRFAVVRRPGPAYPHGGHVPQYWAGEQLAIIDSYRYFPRHG